MWTDAESTKYFSNTFWLLLLITVKIEVRVTKILVNERDCEYRKAVVNDSEVHKADEVSEVRRLKKEIDDELDDVSEVDYEVRSG